MELNCLECLEKGEKIEVTIGNYKVCCPKCGARYRITSDYEPEFGGWLRELEWID